MQRLRYFECEGLPYIYDPATTKLFLATTKKREEITDARERGRILLNSSSLSEDEFRQTFSINATQNVV